MTINYISIVLLYVGMIFMFCVCVLGDVSGCQCVDVALVLV